MIKKVFVRVVLVATLLFAFVLLAGCAGNSDVDEAVAPTSELNFVLSETEGIGGSSAERARLAATEADDEWAAEDEPDSAPVAQDPITTPAPATENRMLIFTGDARIETKDFDQSRAGIESALQAAGGYVQDSELMGDGSEGNFRTYRAVMRIPYAEFHNFMGGINDFGNVLSRNTSGNDVTDRFFDNEARIAILEVEEGELLEIMTHAQTLSEIFTVRDRISEVRTEIERLRGTNILTENQVALSTVTITLVEVQTITPPVEDGFFTRAGHTFSSSWSAFVSFVQGIVLVVIAVLPFLVAFVAIPGAILFFFLRRWKKKKDAAKKKAEEEMRAAHQAYQSNIESE